jgi:hypothetical protein
MLQVDVIIETPIAIRAILLPLPKPYHIRLAFIVKRLAKAAQSDPGAPRQMPHRSNCKSVSSRSRFSSLDPSATGAGLEARTFPAPSFDQPGRPISGAAASLLVPGGKCVTLWLP